MANEKDIKILAELKEKINPKREVSVPISVLQDVCDYCECNAIYDKLGNFGDFYYKIKKLINK